MTIQTDQIITNNELTLLDPIFTLLFVCSLLLVFIQMKFPMKAKHMLFVGVFVLIITAQLWIVYNMLNNALSLSYTSINLVRFIGILALQVMAIIYTYVMEKKKAK